MDYKDEMMLAEVRIDLQQQINLANNNIEVALARTKWLEKRLNDLEARADTAAEIETNQESRIVNLKIYPPVDS